MSAGDAAARDELIRLYLPYAKSLARRFRAATEPTDDLIQVASMGLVKAVDRFDPERGVPFQGFAAPTIMGELKRHFRDRVWTVRVPRGLHDRIADVEQASAQLRADLQRSPSVREIAVELQVSETDVLEVMEANQNRRAISLDLPAGFDQEEGETMIDRIGRVDQSFEFTEKRIAVEGEIPKLGERERTVLHLRFVEEMTQTEIAERVGCSQMQVSRILRKTLSVLRERIETGEESSQPEGPAMRNTT